MNYKSKVASVAVGVLLSAFAVTPVSAAVRCETQYGGGQICVTTGDLQINKEVFDPQNKKFVDNLGINDYRFAPGEEITFRLKIKNVGDSTMGKVNVADSLPSMFGLTSGSLNYDIPDLKSGDTNEQEFKVKVAAANKFPSDKNLVCVINTAETSSGDQRDKDTAQVCLEKKIVASAPKALPPTGPEGAALALLASVITAGSGIYLLKFKAR